MGKKYSVFYGSKVYVFLLKIKLNDFIAEKYPGTEKSYSSFESKVTVQDPEKLLMQGFYMNNVLDHNGYQSDLIPTKGYILSVNHDAWGTGITYAGIFYCIFL
jgi:hypothetical protein